MVYNPKKEIQRPIKDDFESIKRSVLANNYLPIDVKINTSDAKGIIEEECSTKLINERIKSFEQGYQFLTEEIT